MQFVSWIWRWDAASSCRALTIVSAWFWTETIHLFRAAALSFGWAASSVGSLERGARGRTRVPSCGRACLVVPHHAADMRMLRRARHSCYMVSGDHTCVCDENILYSYIWDAFAFSALPKARALLTDVVPTGPTLLPVVAHAPPVQRWFALCPADQVEIKSIPQRMGELLLAGKILRSKSLSG